MVQEVRTIAEGAGQAVHDRQSDCRSEAAETSSLFENLYDAGIDIPRILDACPVPLAISTLDEGRYVEVNESYLQLSGFKRDEVIGRTSLELGIWVNPIDRNELLRNLNEIHKLRNVPLLFRIKSGEIKSVLLSTEVVTIAERAYLISAANDVSELREIEARLRESEQRFQRIVDLTTDWIWEIDADARYTYISPTIETILGYDHNDWIGRHFLEMMTPEEAERQSAILMSAWNKRQPVAFFEGRLMASDGREIFVEASALPIINRAGNLTGYHGVTRDITPRKKAEEALRKREAELENQRTNLKGAVTTLRVLLKYMNDIHKELEKKILSNVKDTIMPYMEKLKSTNLDITQYGYLEIIEGKLTDIVSPFTERMKFYHASLSPREIQVANAVRDGRTTKEIAQILIISSHAVALYRHNIRRKLGLKNKRISLRNYLLTLQQEYQKNVT